MTEICYKNYMLSKKIISYLSLLESRKIKWMDERWKEAVAKAVVGTLPQICFINIPVFLMPLLSGREKKPKKPKQKNTSPGFIKFTLNFGY